MCLSNMMVLSSTWNCLSVARVFLAHLNNDSALKICSKGLNSSRLA